jgi:FXSXX-COOH protein
LSSEPRKAADKMGQSATQPLLVACHNSLITQRADGVRRVMRTVGPPRFDHTNRSFRQRRVDKGLTRAMRSTEEVLTASPDLTAMSLGEMLTVTSSAVDEAVQRVLGESLARPPQPCAAGFTSFI